MNLLINRKIINVKSVKKVFFANMVGDERIAKIVEEAIFANMVVDDVNANYVKSAHTETKQWTVQLVIKNK